MKTSKFYFWVEGEENQKLYFDDTKKFLRFLKENDPTLSGAEKMTFKEFNRIPKFLKGENYV